MENENKRFASISISFLILFIMKLIVQIKILFPPKLKVYFSNIQIKEIINCCQNIYVKIPLLSSVFGSKDGVYKTSEYLVIYRYWITAFQITCQVKKMVANADVTI